MPSLKDAVVKVRHASIDWKHRTLLASINGSVKSSSASESSSEGPLNELGEPMSKHQRRKNSRKEDQDTRRRLNEKRNQELEEKKRLEDELAAREEPPELHARYGALTINQSQSWNHEQRFHLSELTEAHLGQEITFRARIHAVRRMSSRLVFLVFRQQIHTIQGVLHHELGVVTTHMVHWAEHLPAEAVVLVTGKVQKPKEEVTGTSLHTLELAVRDLHLISNISEAPPFDVYEVDISQKFARHGDTSKSHLSDRTRLSHRIVDLRTAVSQSIFRVQSGICNLFRSYLDTQDFIEIHTPKLQGGATESGASVFKVEYFGRPAFLAQSPQLAKQMCVAADFERVYEIGAVFRAENSNTHRHMTEYTGLDLEMAIEEHYHEALTVIDATFKHIFKGLYERYRKELDQIKEHYPHEDLVWLEKTPIIQFKEGIKMLNESGWKNEEGQPLPEDEDLGTRDEIRLGQLVKEKYLTDFYVLDKFPASARPFYTMPDPNDERYTNSFDIFIRGQEVLSGGQRIHDSKMLEERMAKQGLRPNAMEDYLSGFRWGAPPHAGGGIGLERVVMLILGLGDIRHASLYPRDPRSFPVTALAPELRHPEASTIHPPWEGRHHRGVDGELQPLEKLIANYGDSSNTSWLDDRYQVWRHDLTGAAVGFVPSEGYGIIVGDPLCDKSQYGMVIPAFLKWLKTEQHLKPIWILAGDHTETTLGTKLNWRTFTCVGEQRADPSKDMSHHDSAVARKVRHAEKEGVKVISSGSSVPDDIRQQCELRMKDWQANRHGTQVHLTALHPWRDSEHRLYFYAQDKEGTVCALVVLAQLSPEHGYQIKYALDFPGSPSGTIEYITLRALKAAGEAGAKSVTFGGGASSQLTPGHHLSGLRIKVLSRSYHSIATQLKLTQKSEFREKLGAKDEPVYVCYPEHGLGPKAVQALMNFFEADES
ncbi:aspartyl-tRNA synthetase [Xylona heveae TC161]|uniref:Aspartate--tRNA ligase, cytoplasmic n=1 Tax=Xylona heveae (strain CBS 132557 / TC161) TaxID=1328760 RepID=A0A165HUQ2_XYLHT|nr:aspartyl-tRNA synthetase [Xylona heveae TC161]KZF23951.1 aspartyl-tRNA synthetase [Xylona heveae TC161]